MTRGAYGLSISGLGADSRYLPFCPPEWPRWEIAWSDPATHTTVGAVYPVNVGGLLDIDFTQQRAVIATSDRPTEAAVAHPWLAPIGAAVANERGQVSFHGGGVIVGGRVWVVLGAKEAGKSTTLAGLHRDGYVVTSDDLVVVAGRTVLAGPGCLDLREPAALALGLGERISLVADRVRWRVELPPPPATAPLGGFVLPAWTTGPVTVEPVPAAERVPLLFASRAALWRDDRAATMLELARLPVLRWSRPRAIEQLTSNLAPLIERMTLEG